MLVAIASILWFHVTVCQSIVFFFSLTSSQSVFRFPAWMWSCQKSCGWQEISLDRGSMATGNCTFNSISGLTARQIGLKQVYRSQMYFDSSFLMDFMFLSCSESFTEENGWQIRLLSTLKDIWVTTCFGHDWCFNQWGSVSVRYCWYPSYEGRVLRIAIDQNIRQYVKRKLKQMLLRWLVRLF